MTPRYALLLPTAPLHLSCTYLSACPTYILMYHSPFYCPLVCLLVPCIHTCTRIALLSLLRSVALLVLVHSLFSSHPFHSFLSLRFLCFVPTLYSLSVTSRFFVVVENPKALHIPLLCTNTRLRSQATTLRHDDPPSDDPMCSRVYSLS